MTISKPGYSNVTRIFHWGMALLMIVNVVLGLLTTVLDREGVGRAIVMFNHKSIGVTVIFLTVARLIWVKTVDPHIDHSGFKPWEVVAAKIGHWLLYAILLLMPISGVMVSQGCGHEISVFGLFNLPEVVPTTAGIADEAQASCRLGRFLHPIVFQWSLYAIFALHMAGVIKHQFIDGDRQFIRRMWGKAKP
jgi:cytochrome b561